MEIKKIAAGLMAILSMLAFVLSYDALRAVALAHGISVELSFLWPILIDGALVICSLAALRARALKTSLSWPRLMIATFTLATVFFNLVHVQEIASFVPAILLNGLVAAVPPLALVLAFETFVLMVDVNAEAKEPGWIKALKDAQELTWAQVAAKLNVPISTAKRWDKLGIDGR